ncbi:hypothetical protein [Spirobacillus cienkowskii]|uniref:RCC1 domain-containing protein n=1 Tax=Spirobacillus cienkowskii TaxID=495820 RepID=UPI0030CE5BD8
MLKNKVILLSIFGGSVLLHNFALPSEVTAQRKKRSVVMDYNDSFLQIATSQTTVCTIKSSNFALECSSLYQDGSRFIAPHTAISGEFVSVALSASHFCAIAKNSNALLCWGNNNFGQLGIGNTVSQNVPTAVSSQLKFIQVVAGTQNTYAISQSGELFGWGYNSNGQLPSRDLNVTEPIKIQFQNNATKFFQVAAGNNFYCVLSQESEIEGAKFGNIYCAGENKFGQVGVKASQKFVKQLQKVGNKQYLSVAVGQNHACAVTKDSKVECWGDNTFGQVGVNPRNKHYFHKPQKLLSSQENFNNLKFKNVVATNFSTCVIDENNKLYCFGDNTFGQLGGEPKFNTIPINFLGNQTRYIQFEPRAPYSEWNQNVAMVTGNDKTTCSINNTDSSILCWGFIDKNKYQNLSMGTVAKCGISIYGDRLLCDGKLDKTNSIERKQHLPWVLPTQTPWASKESYEQISMNSYIACGVTKGAEQNLACWDYEATTDRSDLYAFPETTFKDNSPIVPFKVEKVVVGTKHICLIRSFDNALFCSGDNSYGQLGNSNYNSTNLLKEFEEVKINKVSIVNENEQETKIKFKDIALTFNTTCALTEDNDVYCFGSNNFGELGVKKGLFNSVSTPQKIENFKLENIYGGLNHFCGFGVTNQTSKLYCWGDNTFGQTTKSFRNNKPVEIENSEEFKFVSVGDNITCALNNNNELACFGSNETQIISENPEILYTSVPIPVKSETKFLSITVGNTEICGITKENNALMCWGGLKQ